MYQLQKASIWKRISASMLDIVTIISLSILIAIFILWVGKYNAKADRLNQIYDEYDEAYGVELRSDYNGLSDEEKAKYEEAYNALIENDEFVYTYDLIINITILSITISVFVSFLVFEFIIPLILKDGRTFGKKIFGIGVMQVNCVKLNHFALFARNILGKYTIETMVPILLILLLYFGVIGIVGIIVILLLLVLQILLIIFTKTNSLIHDVFASTVVIDYNSQNMFASLQEKEEYEKEQALEEAKKAEYF